LLGTRNNQVGKPWKKPMHLDSLEADTKSKVDLLGVMPCKERRNRADIGRESFWPFNFLSGLTPAK
jgi:hypothetical protein